MALQGNLGDLPLIDLVQVLSLQNKTGVLSVNRDFSQAQVCFSKSKIYSAFVHHARSKGQMINRQGEDALYDLLGWQDGQFVFELTSMLPADQNVHATWDYIVLEQCRREDEHEQNVSYLGSLCPQLSLNPPGQAEITLNLDEWQVLLQVNGQNTFKEIASRICKPLDGVVELARKLEKQGLIEPLAVAGRQAASTRFNVDLVKATQPVAYQTRPQPKPSVRWSAPALTPALAGASAQSSAPRVHRGILSGIMAKIRGL